MNKSFAAVCFVLLCGQTLALETTALKDEQGTGKLYFTGPGYTINLIPQAILLGILAFLAVYFLGIDLFGSSAPASGYGAPEPAYGAPETGYDSPAYSRYYDANADGFGYDEATKKAGQF